MSSPKKTSIGGADFALFAPNPPGGEGMGRWLKQERTLEYYDLKTNEVVEFKKKHDAIKIKLVDETVKTMILDMSLPLNEVVMAIGAKISIKNADEFSLQLDSKPGQWMKPEFPITEQVDSLDHVFLLRQRFHHDRNLDQDDPVQLHLVYCQARDDLVSGRHPVTKEEAIEFGALQAQIQLGDFKPDVHKSGFLNMKEVLAPQWAKKDLEKPLYTEWKKLVGMNEINARFRYVQKCRNLKTYGMTVYKVKERVPGKKKLMNTLLAFNRDSIIRMEFESKKVIKEYPLRYLLRWAASPETFTLDFGAHEEDYMVVVTKEGDAISSLVAGYIDLLLKKQKDGAIIIDDDDMEVGAVSTVKRLGGLGAASVVTNNFASSDVTYSQSVSDCSNAARAIEKMINDLFGEVGRIQDGSMTAQQRREAIEKQARDLAALAETIENFAKTADRSGLNAAAQKISVALEQLIVASRQAAASGADPNGILMDATKGVSDALKNLLNLAATCANKPGDMSARDALARAQLAAQAALQKLAAASKGYYADEGFQQLFKELAKSVATEAQIMSLYATDAAQSSELVKKNLLMSGVTALGNAEESWTNVTGSLAATAQDPSCKITIEKAGTAIERKGQELVDLARANVNDPIKLAAIQEAQRRLAKALADLLGISDLPHMINAKEAEEFTESATALLQNCAAILASEGSAQLIRAQADDVRNNTKKLGISGKSILANMPDEQTKQKLGGHLKAVVAASNALLSTSAVVLTTPNDKEALNRLYNATTELAEATNHMISDTGRQVAVSALYSSAKLAAATTVSLCSSSRMAHARLNERDAQNQLDEATKAASEAVAKLIGVLKSSNQQAGPARPARRLSSTKSVNNASNLVKDDLLTSAEQFAPTAYKLVSTSKGVSPKITENEVKQDLLYCSSNAAKAIHKMLANRKALKAVKGQLEIVNALDEFRLAQSDIESALISSQTGILRATLPKDQALSDVFDAIQEINIAARDVTTTARNAPEDVGSTLKKLVGANSKAVSSATALAASVDDKNLQRAILMALKTTSGDVKSLMNFAKAVAASPEDSGLNRSMENSNKNLEESLRKLGEAAKGVVPKNVEEQQAKAQSNIEDLAEKELRSAAEAIERCVARLNAASEAAKLRAQETGLDIDEQNITGAILDASQEIAKSTALLIHAATVVQREFTAAAKEPKAASVYKRDPTWAQGLISAARNVAATVQHLVSAANDAAQGNASEEALIVAAQAVAAATVQLVAASTVKADPNADSQRKLREAATKVAGATQRLVKAAKDAAQWEMDKEEEELRNMDQSDAENKIKLMEKQMEILRKEKEIEDKQRELMNMRKNEYEGAALPAPLVPSTGRTAGGPPQQRGPPSKMNGPPTKVNGVPVKASPGQPPVNGPGRIPQPVNPPAKSTINGVPGSRPMPQRPVNGQPNGQPVNPGQSVLSKSTGRPLPPPGRVNWNNNQAAQ
eukprot:TRINITY_DN1628_c0_g1_i11.p1 TRINITY_DN1628_c0_g1~~TRINITY_DN1628_c0_g1_i11.p1  ORF type:complete len:1470 (+),score=507.85 TRINITY_DN1628_c0_g1_i11:150-4559(+)